MHGFRPLHDRVLVRRIESEETTPAGIIIPNTAKSEADRGRSPGGRSWRARREMGPVIPLEVKVGDRVLFGKWAGTDVLMDGEERLILKESDILGVIEGKMRARARAACPRWLRLKAKPPFGMPARAAPV